MSKYQEAYDESINNPEKFWGEAAKEIHWYKPYTRVLDDSKKPFTGGLSAVSLIPVTMLLTVMWRAVTAAV
jgi:hypothetical protein